MCVDMPVNMRVDMCIKMCTEVRIEMYKDMGMGVCRVMHSEMCVGMWCPVLSNQKLYPSARRYA